MIPENLTAERKRIRAELIGDNAKRALKFQAWASLEFGPPAGIFLREMVFWDGRGMDPDGFIYKTEDELKAIGLSRHYQRKARKTLQARGVLEEEKRGVPCRLWYRVNLGLLLEMFECGEQETEQRTLNSNYSPTNEGAEQVRPARVPDKPDKLGRRTIQREPDRTQSQSHGFELTSEKRGRLDKCVTILNETDLFSKDSEKLAQLVEELMRRHPNVDPLLVCNEFRDYTLTQTIKNPPKLLETFFENAAKKQKQEPMNPHSPEGERAKSRANRPDWYAAFYGVSLKEAEELTKSGLSHEEICAMLNADSGEELDQ